MTTTKPPKPKKSKPAPPTTAPGEHLSDVIVHVPVDNLHPDPRNPRRITAQAKKRLLLSLQGNGFLEPVLARSEDGLILGGHQRWTVYKEAGQPTVPVRYVTGVSNQRARIINLALNAEDAQGRWDTELLRTLLAESAADGMDLALTGFEDNTLQKMLSTKAMETFDYMGEQPASGIPSQGNGNADSLPPGVGALASPAVPPRYDPLAPRTFDRYPLAIVLAQDDYTTWQAVKQALDQPNDAKALLLLVRFHADHAPQEA